MRLLDLRPGFLTPRGLPSPPSLLKLPLSPPPPGASLLFNYIKATSVSRESSSYPTGSNIVAGMTTLGRCLSAEPIARTCNLHALVPALPIPLCGCVAGPWRGRSGDHSLNPFSPGLGQAEEPRGWGESGLGGQLPFCRAVLKFSFPTSLLQTASFPPLSSPFILGFLPDAPCHLI